MDPRVNRLICRVDSALFRHFPVVTALGPSGPFPAVWALSAPRRQGVRVAFCTEGGPSWKDRPGSRAGKPIALFIYPGRRTGHLRDAECDWDISVPDDPDEWDPMVEELVGTIREWEALFLTENPSAVLPSQVKETHHGEEDDGEEGRGQANHHHRR